MDSILATNDMLPHLLMHHQDYWYTIEIDTPDVFIDHEFIGKQLNETQSIIYDCISKSNEPFHVRYEKCKQYCEQHRDTAILSFYEILPIQGFDLESFFKTWNAVMKLNDIPWNNLLLKHVPGTVTLFVPKQLQLDLGVFDKMYFVDENRTMVRFKYKTYKSDQVLDREEETRKTAPHDIESKRITFDENENEIQIMHIQKSFTKNYALNLYQAFQNKIDMTRLKYIQPIPFDSFKSSVLYSYDHPLHPVEDEKVYYFEKMFPWIAETKLRAFILLFLPLMYEQKEDTNELVWKLSKHFDYVARGDSIQFNPFITQAIQGNLIQLQYSGVHFKSHVKDAYFTDYIKYKNKNTQYIDALRYIVQHNLDDAQKERTLWTINDKTKKIMKDFEHVEIEDKYGTHPSIPIQHRRQTVFKGHKSRPQKYPKTIHEPFLNYKLILGNQGKSRTQRFTYTIYTHNHPEQHWTLRFEMNPYNQTCNIYLSFQENHIEFANQALHHYFKTIF
jgi:hypothetical protein